MTLTTNPKQVPTIRQFPGSAKLPDSFKTLREVVKTSSKKQSGGGNTTNLNRGTAPQASAAGSGTGASQVVVLRSQLWWQGSDRSSEDV